jgi:hypothetical protein
VPLELVAAAARSTILHLGEVALEESDLVLVVLGRLVGAGSLDREVVVDLALVDGGGGLGNQLSPEHGLAVPLGSLIDGDLDTLLGASVGGVLELRVEIDVVGNSTGTVDVVLVSANGIGERPLLEICARSHIVEASIPDDCAYRNISNLLLNNIVSQLTSRHSADERIDESDLGKHVEVNADRDQLYGKERVLRDEKKDCSKVNDEQDETTGTSAHI